MKKLKILDSKKNLTIIELEEIMVDTYLESIASSESFGKPERSVPASADFDEADVIERFDIEMSPAIAEVVNDASEIVQEAIPAVTVPMVKLRAEYTIEILDITAQVEQEKINAEALAYLASSDWYILREIDAGVPCPAEVKAERAAARARIVR